MGNGDVVVVMGTLPSVHRPAVAVESGEPFPLRRWSASGFAPMKQLIHVCLLPVYIADCPQRPALPPAHCTPSLSPFLELATIDSLLGREDSFGVWLSRSLNIYNFISLHVGLDNLSLLVSHQIDMTRYSGTVLLDWEDEEVRMR